MFLMSEGPLCKRAHHARESSTQRHISPNIRRYSAVIYVDQLRIYGHDTSGLRRWSGPLRQRRLTPVKVRGVSASWKTLKTVKTVRSRQSVESVATVEAVGRQLLFTYLE